MKLVGKRSILRMQPKNDIRLPLIRAGSILEKKILRRIINNMRGVGFEPTDPYGRRS